MRSRAKGERADGNCTQNMFMDQTLALILCASYFCARGQIDLLYSGAALPSKATVLFQLCQLG
jgi:hypothetical protein